MPLSRTFACPPHRFSGTVISALLNHPAQLQALDEAVSQPPYKAPPQAPVLAVRPRHMLAADGCTVLVPAAAAGLVVGAALGLVLGRTAHRVSPEQALACVSGYVLMGEIAMPMAGPQQHYRPAVRQLARDNFCPLSKQVVPASHLPRPDALAVQIFVDGHLYRISNTGGRVRGAAQLLADVSQFITLQPGDVLGLGAGVDTVVAGPGQHLMLRIEGLGSLSFGLAAEAANQQADTHARAPAATAANVASASAAASAARVK